MYQFYLNYFTQSTEFPFFIQYGQHDGNLFVHTHADFNEITIVLSGTATHIVNNDKYLIKKGDMFVIGDNIAHGFENPHNFKICNIMYRLSNLLQSDNDITKSAGFHRLFVLEPYLNKERRFGNKMHLSLTQFEIISTLIAGMIDEYQTKEEGWKTALHANFNYLVVLLSRAYNTSSNSKDIVLNMALPITYISNHFAESISIVELAKQANMSERHFTRIFHHAYNMSPNNYIIQYRIQYSYTLLKNSDLTISEIAMSCGFNDSTYYSRQFKKLTGFTPSEYRKFLSLNNTN